MSLPKYGPVGNPSKSTVYKIRQFLAVHLLKAAMKVTPDGFPYDRMEDALELQRGLYEQD